MRSLNFDGSGRVSLVEIPDPEPGLGEVLVRIEASALCGSERPDLINGYPGNVGHEACGVLIDPGGSGIPAGSRVGLAAIIGCGTCDRCVIGQELHCRTPPREVRRPAWHCDLAVVSASALRALPSDLDPGLGALVTGDALGVPVRAMRRAPSAPGDRVLVIGLGPVGLSHVLLRSFLGAEVVAIEPSEYRRDLARALGALHVQPVEVRLDRRPQLVLECSGRRESITRAFEEVDNAGVVMQSAECSTEIGLVPSDLMIRREITYTGSWYYSSEDFPEMLELVGRGFPISRLVTHDVLAADAQAAVTAFLNGRAGKVVLRWS